MTVIIYEFEKSSKSAPADSKSPHFFSLQFSMQAHTPEVFAARGIVALQPPPVVKAPLEDIRGQALGMALCDLVTRKKHSSVPATDIYSDLETARLELSSQIGRALDSLQKVSGAEKGKLMRPEVGRMVVKTLQSSLGELASQGVYLINEQGEVVAFSTPSVIPQDLRKAPDGFSNRPYFRQARSFRESFVSDMHRSRFNGRGTFFICQPILSGDHMEGLLFSACQIGQWKAPLTLAKRFWETGKAFVLVDSNGVCLLPPNNEFGLEEFEESNATGSTKPGANLGYPFTKLLSLSYRDRVISHIGRSVVPVALDDDVQHFSGDFAQFSVISEVPKTRWKIALSFGVVR